MSFFVWSYQLCSPTFTAEDSRYIVEYEQAGYEKAEYGSETLQMLAKDLTNRYGTGFSRSNISRMRQLYLAYPKCATLSHKLSWSHYVELLKIDDPQERSFYLRECEQENWGVRELKRQMKSMLFQRLVLSKNKDEVMRLAQQGQIIEKPEDIVKDPYVCQLSAAKAAGLKEHGAVTAYSTVTAPYSICLLFHGVQMGAFDRWQLSDALDQCFHGHGCVGDIQGEQDIGFLGNGYSLGDGQDGDGVGG